MSLWRCQKGFRVLLIGRWDDRKTCGRNCRFGAFRPGLAMQVRGTQRICRESRALGRQHGRGQI